MECPKCGAENRDGVKFCEECGAKMEFCCPECGASIPLGKKFCGECGHPLKPPIDPPPTDYTQPKSYTPKFMAEKILTTRSAVEGERKMVTVLFADVAGFTSLSEKMDPEEVHEVMDGCFKILMEVIHKYEGTINQFTGDGVMAIFGAPLAHEDHAQRACYASLSIQRGLRDYEEKIRREFGTDFKMRIGLNSGPVVVGSIGDDLRVDYTAVGDTTNLAARMESLAEPGKIMASRTTKRLVHGYFELISLGKVPIKGKADAQDVFEVVNAGPLVSRLDASTAKGLTAFVGRGTELDDLVKGFERSRTGHGQVISIVGEAGMGKSRLLFELRNRLPDEAIYLEGRCVQYGMAIPFMPMIDLLRNCFGIKEGDKDDLIRGKVKEKLLMLHELLLEDLPAFEDLLSLPIDNRNWLSLEPKEKREKLFEAMRDLFLRLSEKGPLVLCIDDLHWMDKTSEEFLDYLINWLGHAPIFLILLYRPEYTHPWGSKSFYSKIGLDQLSAEWSLELIKSILKEGQVGRKLTDLILTRAAGNPLFMEELIRTLLENGSIEKKNGGFVLGPGTDRIEVPETVQGIIAARIDRLEDNIKRTMQVASVIGRDFAFRILKMITGTEKELKSHLGRLQGLEFIYEKRLFPELEYIFKHALTQEVAYDTLLKQRRKKLHEETGEAIEKIYGEKLEEYFEILAFHYSRSENFQKAYRYLRLSGGKAMGNHSAWEAFDYYKSAIGALKSLPDSDENHRKLVEVIHEMIVPIIVLGFPSGSLATLQEGERLAGRLGDLGSVTRFYSNMGLCYSSRGNHVDGITYTEKAFQEAERSRDVQSLAQSVPDLCLAYMTEGRYDKAMDVAGKVIRSIEETHTETETFGGPANVYPTLISVTGYCQAMLGHFGKAMENCEKGVVHANEIGRAITLGICENYFGSILLHRGNAEAAKDHLERGITYLEQAQFLQPLALALSSMGLALSMLGDPESGIRHVNKGIKILSEGNVEWNLSIHFASLGISYYYAGDLSLALDSLREACSLSRKNQEGHLEGKALTWIGRIQGVTDPRKSSEAINKILKGIKILEELNTRPDVALGYLFLSELYSIVQKEAASRETVAKAEGMLKAMRMGYFLTTSRTPPRIWHTLDVSPTDP